MPERSPDITPTCLKCGSDAMVPDVRMVDRGDANTTRHSAMLGLETRPQAFLMKGEVQVGTRALVCSDCGFVELYAYDPAALWDAHVLRVSRDL